MPKSTGVILSVSYSEGAVVTCGHSAHLSVIPSLTALRAKIIS